MLTIIWCRSNQPNKKILGTNSNLDYSNIQFDNISGY